MPDLKPKKSNKTRDYINSFGPNHPGNQGFWGEALTDIPHPTKLGEVMKYSQFKEYLHSPEMINNPQYNDENKRSQYGTQVFKDAQTRFYQKADSNPNQLVFPSSATDALNKPIDEFKAQHGDYLQSNKAYTSDLGKERLNDIKNSQSSQSLASYKMGTKSIKIKDKSKGKLSIKSVNLQKAANGLTDVAIPEAGSMGNVLSSGLSTAETGASVAGPWGAVGGAVLGLGMGLVQKSKQDKVNRTALAINNDNRINRQYDGVDPTINQKTQVYKKGTKSLKTKGSKLIEAEHNEHVFDENLNHKGVIKGKTHEEGGEVVSVEEGDSIFPAKHKEKVDKHLKTGDKVSLHKLRTKLPKDTNQKKAEFGLNTSDDDIPDPIAYAKRDKSLRVASFNNKPLFANDKNRVGQYGAYQSAVDGLGDGSSEFMTIGQKGNPYPYSVVKNSNGNMYRHNEMPQLKPINTLLTQRSNPSIVPPTSLPGGTAPISQEGTPNGEQIGDPNNGNGIGDIGKYANIANNVVRGFQTPKPIEQNYLDPELLKYTDRSETLRRDSRSNQSIQNANARNVSGGMAGNIRANQAASGTQNLENQDSINEREMARADQVDNQNVGIKNSAKEVNLGRKDAYQDQLLRQRASNENYQNAAVQEATQLAERNEATNYQKSRDAREDQKDERTLKYLNQTTRYQVDDKKDEINFNPNSYTSANNSLTPKTSTTKSVDKNGKESTRTTVSSAPTSKVNSLLGRTLKKNRKLR